MFYRVRQVWLTLHAAPLSETETRRVREYLADDKALALFQTMPPADQRHSLNILDELLAQGHGARPLVQAALLHDVAKRRVGLGARIGVVLMNALAPGLLARVASPNVRNWRYPFYLSLHHPELGAALAAAAGLDPRAVELMRAHQTVAPPFQGPDAESLRTWHRALKARDDVS